VIVNGSEVDKEITLKATYTWFTYVPFTPCSKGAEGDSRFVHNTTMSSHINTSSSCRWWLSVPEVVGWCYGNLETSGVQLRATLRGTNYGLQKGSQQVKWISLAKIHIFFFCNSWLTFLVKKSSHEDEIQISRNCYGICSHVMQQLQH